MDWPYERDEKTHFQNTYFLLFLQHLLLNWYHHTHIPRPPLSHLLLWTNTLWSLFMAKRSKTHSWGKKAPMHGCPLHLLPNIFAYFLAKGHRHFAGAKIHNWKEFRLHCSLFLHRTNRPSIKQRSITWLWKKTHLLAVKKGLVHLWPSLHSLGRNIYVCLKRCRAACYKTLIILVPVFKTHTYQLFF